jgi:hypothetical protein
MNEGRNIETRIQRYLDEIRTHLGDLSEEEINDVLESVYTHVHSELQTRSDGPPTLEYLEEVLKEMDPPDAYAKNILRTTEDFSTEKRISRYAIIGAALLPFGFGLALIFFPVSSVNPGATPTFWQWILRFTILPLGILAPFACTALGLMGISEIRISEGKVVGMPLAFFVGIFYPILVLDVVLFLFTAMVFSAEDYWNIVLAISLIVILIVDYFSLKYAWRKITTKS